jgi:heme exporter protein C
MWWKSLSVVLILYVLIAGLLVPLKSGIERVSPDALRCGDTVALRLYGYNTFFTKNGDQALRVWLTFDDKNAIMAESARAINDTILEARFRLPDCLPKEKTSAYLNMIADHPEAGASILPAGVEIRLGSADPENCRADSLWQLRPVENLHVQTGFSYPYQNVIYETIRNTYFHVPMWFALMFLFTSSVWFSLKYLRDAKPEYDRRAAAAKYTWGQPWSNDIKQLMTAVALLIYLAYFILRRSFDDPQKGARLAAAYNIFAFASLIPLLYIVPRMFASLHPGATGNPAFGSQDLDNTMRAVFYPAIIGWTLLGYWVAELRFRIQRLEDKKMGMD